MLMRVKFGSFDMTTSPKPFLRELIYDDAYIKSTTERNDTVEHTKPKIFEPHHHQNLKKSLAAQLKNYDDVRKQIIFHK